MPHKGTPIRYGQKQPVRSRQQGAVKISPRRIGLICQQEIFSCGQPKGYPTLKLRFPATQNNQPACVVGALAPYNHGVPLAGGLGERCLLA